jgi:uncharacterized protein YndB with AHSA1/START domain
MLERHIVIPASQQEVWETLTDPITVSTWFGAEVDWDLSPGGPARFLGDDGAVRDGRVDEVVPDQRLRFRWWPEGEADEETSEVTYLLEPHEDGTDLTIPGVRLECGDVDNVGWPLGRRVEPGHGARDDWHPLIHRRRRTPVPTASLPHWPIQPDGNCSISSPLTGH